MPATITLLDPSQVHSEPYEAGRRDARADREAGRQPRYSWPEDSEAFFADSYVEGYLSAASSHRSSRHARMRPMYGRGRHGDYSTATIREALEAIRGLLALFVPSRRQA